MYFIDVTWVHNNSSDPVRLVSELDAERNETRKLEFYRNGRVGFASEFSNSPDTMLSIEPVPQLEEINSDPQFVGVVMSSADFESLWGQHARQHT